MIAVGTRIEATPDALAAVEAELKEQTGAPAVAWCGRGATALYWAYRLAAGIGEPNPAPEVILPAISCTTASAALVAGLTPRFADVERSSGLLSLRSVQDRWSARTKAVVFVHLYGQTADLLPLAALCRERGAILIEDAAQATGARLPGGDCVGSVGDLTVHSFSRTKILDCGGGALVLRAPDLAERFQTDVSEYSLPGEVHPETRQALERSRHDIYRGLLALLRLDAGATVSEPWLNLHGAFDPLFLRPMTNPDALRRAWDRLPGILERRCRNASIYEQKLSGGPWELLGGWRESGACWRYSLLVDFPADLVAFSEAVRGDGFHVSNLYWPESQLFRPDDVAPNAERLARRIVNLWVDDTVDESTVEACADSLRTHAARFASGGPWDRRSEPRSD